MARAVSADGLHFSRASRAAETSGWTAPASSSISRWRAATACRQTVQSGSAARGERGGGVVEELGEGLRAVPVGRAEEAPEDRLEFLGRDLGDAADRTGGHASLQSTGLRGPTGRGSAPVQRGSFPRVRHLSSPARTTLVGCPGRLSARLRRGSPISGPRVPSPKRPSAPSLPPRREPGTPSRVSLRPLPPSVRGTPTPRWCRWRTPSRARCPPRWTAWPTATRSSSSARCSSR